MTATGAIAVVAVGHRVIMNTKWPVEKYLSRHNSKKGFKVTTVCNGMAEGYKWFLTEEQAREHMAAFGEVTDL